MMGKARECPYCRKTHRSEYKISLCRASYERFLDARVPKTIVINDTVTAEGAAAGRRFAIGWLRKKVLERDGYRCRYCGKTVSDKNANMDHIVPWPEGLTTEANLATSCRPCNQAKGSSRGLPRPLPNAEGAER